MGRRAVLLLALILVCTGSAHAQRTKTRFCKLPLTNDARINESFERIDNIFGPECVGGHVIQDNGMALSQRPFLNFPAGCTDDPANNATQCTGGGGGGGGGGRIVNVGARVSELPIGGAVAYSISKAGVAALTRALAVELKGEDILVNAVLPSIIDTPANRTAMPKANPANWPRPEELARTILWLASPENTLTSGALVPVYGRA